MAEMTEDEQLKEVKDSLGITGNYQDARLLGYLREIKQYLTDAGVPKENLSSSAVMGFFQEVSTTFCITANCRPTLKKE